MTKIDHIVFDIGKVLIHYDPHIPYSRLIPDADERQWFFENVCTHDWNLEQDRGRRWEDAEALLLERFPEREEHIRAFRKFWHEMVSHSYDDSVAIMVALIDSGHDVTMLTNFASDTFREAQKMFPFLTLPRGVTVSGDVKLAFEAGCGDLPSARQRIRPQSGHQPLHRRYARQCRRRQGRRLAGRAFYRRGKAEAGFAGLWGGGVKTFVVSTPIGCNLRAGHVCDIATYY